MRHLHVSLGLLWHYLLRGVKSIPWALFVGFVGASVASFLALVVMTIVIVLGHWWPIIPRMGFGDAFQLSVLVCLFGSTYKAVIYSPRPRRHRRDPGKG